MRHLLNWVEIPVNDFERARTFYETIMNVKFQEMEMDEARYAIFPSGDKFNCGALVKSEYHRPCPDGVVVYLDGRDDMDIILNKVESAGGEVIMTKTYTGDTAGYIGMFSDSEGNKIGLQHL